MEQSTSNVLGKASEAIRNVMAMYAGAMCQAQILERELVNVSYTLRMRTGTLKGQDVNWVYEQTIHQHVTSIWISSVGIGGLYSVFKRGGPENTYCLNAEAR